MNNWRSWEMYDTKTWYCRHCYNFNQKKKVLKLWTEWHNFIYSTLELNQNRPWRVPLCSLPRYWKHHIDKILPLRVGKATYCLKTIYNKSRWFNVILLIMYNARVRVEAWKGIKYKCEFSGWLERWYNIDHLRLSLWLSLFLNIPSSWTMFYGIYSLCFERMSREENDHTLDNYAISE